ncbi:MAG: tRNA epoxyqueuosine(34) reductase QueG, partial [Rhodobacteraceae bacterium]|nr:tRNA epoxyqueuosine(34) reductase QueG [Paracoccaceae bacterium]
MLAVLRKELRSRALFEGFSDIGFCAPNGVPEIASRLQRYVDAGHHGQMGWMAQRMNWRGNPAELWPEARSIVMLAETYTPTHDPLAVLQQAEDGAISVYAQNRDYHDIVKKRLKRVGRWLIEQAPDSQIKVFVDTAPVMEKPLAAAAGLGWQGKHTNLVSKDFGSWLFLGEVFTSLDIEPDAPAIDHCGSCDL